MTPLDRSQMPRLGPEPEFRLPQPHKHTLTNGMQCWTVERRQLPMLAVLMLVPVGSGCDPGGRPGLAALTGDMLDEGAGGRSALELQEAFARLGAVLDTEIGPDATIVTVTTLSRYREQALALMADVVWRPRFEAAEFERVRELRVNRLMQLRNVPASLADRAFTRLLYAGDPYGHLPIGTEAGLRAASLDDSREFHGLRYRPSQVTAIAVGDIAHDEFVALAGSVFGTVPARTGNAPIGDGLDTEPAGCAGDARGFWIVPRPGAAQSELRIGQLGVARRTPDYHALLVLNTILGGQFVSRINMNLREHKGFTYGARTTFDFRRRRGPFLMQTSVHTAATAAAIGEAFNEIEAIRDARPPTDEELRLAKAALTRGYPRSFETAEQICRALAQLALYELPDDYFERFIPSISSVDAEAVTRVASVHLEPARMLTVIVGDEEATRGPLEEMGFGRPEPVGGE